MTSKGTILLSGMIAGDPHQGGATWAVLQYVLGFKKLGWDVCLIEPIPANRLDAKVIRYFQTVVNSFDIAANAALLVQQTRQTIGVEYSQLISMAANADVLINIAGMLTDPAIFFLAPTRVYLDLDPAFVQVWNEQGINMRFDGHTHFVTVGQSIGSPDCPVPTAGKEWLRTLPPVVMEHWPMADAHSSLGFTTVGNWRAYGSVQFNNLSLGQKVHSIRPLMNLPLRIGEPVTLAMSIDPSEKKDLDELSAHGWRLTDPVTAAGTPDDYQRFIASSKAEMGIAKHGYVASRCGWFSDRSACYLASGRPVIAQQTGWSSHLPAGDGLLSFNDVEPAAAAAEEINRDYARHSRAARGLAEEFFDSDCVLNRLLSLVGATS